MTDFEDLPARVRESLREAETETVDKEEVIAELRAHGVGDAR